MAIERTYTQARANFKELMDHVTANRDAVIIRRRQGSIGRMRSSGAVLYPLLATGHQARLFLPARMIAGRSWALVALALPIQVHPNEGWLATSGPNTLIVSPYEGSHRIQSRGRLGRRKEVPWTRSR